MLISANIAITYKKKYFLICFISIRLRIYVKWFYFRTQYTTKFGHELKKKLILYYLHVLEYHSQILLLTLSCESLFLLSYKYHTKSFLYQICLF